MIKKIKRLCFFISLSLMLISIFILSSCGTNSIKTQNQVSDLQNQIIDLQKQIDDLQNNITKQNEQITSLDNKNENLQNENQILKNKNEELQNKNKLLSNVVDEYENMEIPVLFTIGYSNEISSGLYDIQEIITSIGYWNSFCSVHDCPSVLKNKYTSQFFAENSVIMYRPEHGTYDYEIEKITRVGSNLIITVIVPDNNMEIITRNGFAIVVKKSAIKNITDLYFEKINN